MQSFIRFTSMTCSALGLCAMLSSCSSLGNDSVSADDLETLVEKSQKHYVNELSRYITIFPNVAYGLGQPLRKYLDRSGIAKDKAILDLGAGSAVLSLIALKNGATKAVATEINQYAVANAKYNARQLGVQDKMEVRSVSMSNPGAYSVIHPSETFDLIVSNPPQGDMKPNTIYEFSYADPKLAFLRSILEGLPEHLTPTGKGVFALYERGLTLARHIAAERNMDLNVYLKTFNKNGIYYIVEIQRPVK